MSTTYRGRESPVPALSGGCAASNGVDAGPRIDRTRGKALDIALIALDETRAQLETPCVKPISIRPNSSGSRNGCLRCAPPRANTGSRSRASRSSRANTMPTLL